MFFPYTTDAPVYYWPHGTVGLIVANVLIFFAVVFGVLPIDGPWFLRYGDGLHPLEWVGSIFMHAGLGHLVSNMLFLWVFGLVVEGKLGAARFLVCYLGLGVTQSALEQLVMLGHTGETSGSLGASSAIYGVMAMAAVWAPANNIRFFYWIFITYRGSVDIPIGAVAAFYIGIDLTIAMATGFGVGTSLLHLSGALLGFPLAVWLLKSERVDCEGWDMFERLGWNEGKKKREAEAKEAEQADKQERLERRKRDHTKEAEEQLRGYLKNGNAAAALTLFEKMGRVGEPLHLRNTDLAELIKGLHRDERWRDSAPFMAELVRRAPQNADPIRLKLAQICVVALGRPGKAIDLVAEIDAKRLNDKQVALAKKIVAKAEAMQMSGHVEIDDDQW